MTGFISGENHVAIVGGKTERILVFQSSGFELDRVSCASWNDPPLRRRAERSRQHPFLIRRKGASIAIPETDGGRSVGLPQENSTVRAPSLAAFVKQHLLTVGREGYQHGAIQPSQLFFFIAFEARKENFALAIINGDDGGAVGGDIVQGQISGGGGQQAESAR